MPVTKRTAVVEMDHKKNNRLFVQSLYGLAGSSVVVNLIYFILIIFARIAVLDRIYPYKSSESGSMRAYVIGVLGPFVISIFLSLNYRYLIKNGRAKSSVMKWIYFSATPIALLIIGFFLAGILANAPLMKII